MEPLRHMASTYAFMPHGFCYLWDAKLVWLHVISDSVIALAYTLIPLNLVYLVFKRRDIPFNWMFLCFGVFIVACGATHVMEVWTIWVPSYWLSGSIKAVTALASMPTALLLVQLLPKALSLPHPDDLKKANAALEHQTSVLQAQTALLEKSEENYRSLFEGAPYGILRASADGSVLMANPALVQMLGLSSKDELIGQKLPVEFWGAKGRKKQASISHPATPEDSEITWKRKDGKGVLLHVKAQPLPEDTESPACIEVAVEDISEKRLLEEELRQAHKMEVIGQLAGGIAHDFNNILVGILGYGELLVKKTEPGTKFCEYCSEIVRAAIRARELTAQLLAFGRKEQLQPRIINLNHSIMQMNEMLVRILGEDIRLVQDLDTTLEPSKVDPIQFEHAILNLVVNARDAMPFGGTLKIKTSYDHGAEILGTGLKNKKHAVISVTDTGSGIDPDTLPHIFEPFFTTKSPGRGTGLGLAMVYSSVKQSEGFIDVNTDVGQGTTFNIHLPCVEEGTIEHRPAAGPPKSSLGSETILLVEDDEVVRTLTSEVLESQGYNVLRAKRGSEAVDWFGRSIVPIDLLVTDVIMPEGNGVDLARQLKQQDPGLKVLYMSGYLSDQVLPQMNLTKRSFFLAKPFLPQEFVSKVREVLDFA